jgi:hypothetical protein
MPVVLKIHIKYVRSSDVCNKRQYENLKFHCVPNINLNITVGYAAMYSTVL